jgi:hypothetical protein
VSAQRANEFTLGGLRPGKDLGSRAVQLFGERGKTKAEDGQLQWRDLCNRQTLVIELDRTGKIEELRTGIIQLEPGVIHDCGPVPPSKWITGHGLRIGDLTAKVLQLYGEPDSKSPSTRDGQPLELWYYAFDWAGPDVPQVMEVLCTREASDQPGHVVEITLAAPSL